MEDALSSLRSSLDDDQVYLRETRTLLRILQNLLNDPDNAKYRTVRAACNVSSSKIALPPALVMSFLRGVCLHTCLFSN